MRDGRLKPKGAVLSGRQLLAQWVVRQRMTQAEAAEQIGVSRVKLNQYLSGDYKPGLEIAIRIEDTTGIGIRTWLVKESAADRATIDVGNDDKLSVEEPTGVGH